MAMTFDAPQEKVRAAQEACRQYAPSGRQQIRDPQMAENLRKLALRLRATASRPTPILRAA
ncbi:hypothetical protein GCM10009850_092930 [Nonomuraea monospora]|uniref:Uncharacterized protein n=1 Tax=Nonomuraea monospora TaxID=568818 RepID=A0ABN3CWG1_9ACTN